MATLSPLPGFPRWTGMKGTTTGPRHDVGGQLIATISVRLTRRALMWCRWRMLTGRWNPDAAAHR
jgi:hypothetical protein